MDTKETDFFNLDEGYFNTVVASDINFKGNLRFLKPLMVRGTFEGRINATSDLVVDTDALVRADIHAERVLVRGKVIGNVSAKSLIFVNHTGALLGDITAEQVVLEPGSLFTGQCTMVGR